MPSAELADRQFSNFSRRLLHGARTNRQARMNSRGSDQYSWLLVPGTHSKTSNIALQIIRFGMATGQAIMSAAYGGTYEYERNGPGAWPRMRIDSGRSPVAWHRIGKPCAIGAQAKTTGAPLSGMPVFHLKQGLTQTGDLCCLSSLGANRKSSCPALSMWVTKAARLNRYRHRYRHVEVPGTLPAAARG
jgi:hypothetical protein